MSKPQASLSEVRALKKQASRRADAAAIAAGTKTVAQVNRDNSLAAHLEQKPRRLAGLGIHSD